MRLQRVNEGIQNATQERRSQNPDPSWHEYAPPPADSTPATFQYENWSPFSKPKPQEKPAETPAPAKSSAKADLPAAIDLSAYCPEVRHQGYIFSCVGWATGYGALSAQRAILNRCTDKEVINRNAHSALFLYNQVKKGDCMQGARISDALEFLQKNGDCASPGNSTST